MFKKYSNKKLNENTNLDKLRNIIGNKNVDVKRIQDNLIFDKNIAQKRLNLFIESTEDIYDDLKSKLIKIEIIGEDLDDNVYIIDIIKEPEAIVDDSIRLNNLLDYKFIDANGNESVNLVNINYIDYEVSIIFSGFDNYNIKYDKLIPRIVNGGFGIYYYNDTIFDNKRLYYCNSIYFDECKIINLNNIENIFNINNIDNIEYLSPQQKNEYKDRIYSVEGKYKRRIAVSDNKNKIIIPSFTTEMNEIQIYNNGNFIINNNKIIDLIISCYGNSKINEEEIKKGIANINNVIENFYIDENSIITSLDFGGEYKMLNLYKTYNLKNIYDLSEKCRNLYINIDDVEMVETLTNDDFFNNLCDFLINKRKNILFINFCIQSFVKNKNEFKSKINELIKILKENNVYDRIKINVLDNICKYFTYM